MNFCGTLKGCVATEINSLTIWQYFPYVQQAGIFLVTLAVNFALTRELVSVAMKLHCFHMPTSLFPQEDSSALSACTIKPPPKITSISAWMAMQHINPCHHEGLIRSPKNVEFCSTLHLNTNTAECRY